MQAAQVVPYIAPELRGNIAQYCAQKTLLRLCTLDRAWAAEAQPLLYTKVHLPLHCEDSFLDFVERVSRSPRKMSGIYSLLIEDKDHDNFAWTDVVLYALHHLLLILPNLVDLRFHGVGHDVQFELLRWVGWPDCPFRLRSLYASWDVVSMFRDLFEDVLRQHRPTLRVLAIEAEDHEQTLEAAGLPEEIKRELISPRCVVFSYFPTPSLFALSISQPDPAKIAVVAQSIADDPSADFACSPVRALRLDYMELPAASPVAHALSSHFPDVYIVTLVIPEPADLAALAATATAFPYLKALHITGRWQWTNFQISDDPIPWPEREAWAMELVAYGCPRLREVVRPDGLITSRDVDEDGGLSDWYDGGAWLDRLNRWYAEAEAANAHSSS